MTIELETQRLRLRRWREEDLEPFAALCADPDVMVWLGGTMDRAACADRIAAVERQFDVGGYGRFAIERLEDGAFLGHCGLMPIGAEVPLPSGVEIGWRLGRWAWGEGYASEAARAVLRDGFGRLGLREIWSFTAITNRRSEAVMTRAGLSRRADLDFEHPVLAPGHPLRPHLVYAASRNGC